MDNKSKTKFTQWVQLAECKTLKPNQRIILITILNLHNIEGWDFTPLSVLNEKNGISVSTIQRSIKGLVKMGLIEKVSNRNRKKCGKDPNDYIPNYTNILNLLNSQIGQNDHNKNNSYGQNDHNSYSQNDHNDMVKMTNKNNRKKEKEKNKASIYSNYNDSTRRYMVYPENEKNQITNTDMKNQITNNPKNGQPINDLQVFDFSDCDENPNSLEVLAAERDKTENAADRSAAINPKDAETAYEYAMIGYITNPKTALNSPKAAGATEIAHSEVLSMQVDSYPTHAEKTPQEGNIGINWTGDKTAADNDNTKTTDTNTDSPINDVLGLSADLGDGDSPTTTEETATESDKSQDTEANPTATNIQETQINGRGEEITPQADNYTTAAEKTPQGAKNSGMAADTADTRPIFDTVRTAAEWKVRHGNDSCWEETFEHAAEGLEAPLETEIRNLLNQVYKDWQNHTAAINTKMINDMKVYAERHYGIILTSKEKKGTVNYCIPRHDAVPTAEEIEKLSVCHISNNMDILNRLSAGCKQVNTVILALNKAIEFTQIHRIATAQSYECVSNAMATIDQNPAMSDKKIKYITDLATHLCDMLEKVCKS